MVVLEKKGIKTVHFLKLHGVSKIIMVNFPQDSYLLAPLECYDHVPKDVQFKERGTWKNLFSVYCVNV